MNTDEAYESMKRSEKRNELRRSGWTSIPCHRCKGTGVDMPSLGKCHTCEGKGEKWHPPLVN